jgi:acyl carrier protein
MSKAASTEEIFPVVRACLASSLAIAPSEIAPASRLIDDLGADSLDFLDILFSLEKSFSLKLRGAELDSLLRADFAEGRLVDKRYIAREEIERMREWLPALESAPDLGRITPQKLFSYISAESLVILLQKKLRET